MKTMESNRAKTYRNAIESLVVEEVERQLQRLPSRLSGYLNRTEVIAYALNRLPALYATSERGWQQQRMRGKNEMGNQIVAAVRQAIAAVQRDPLRAAKPLPPIESIEPDTALQSLKELLRREDVSWRNLADVVEQTLVKTARGEITWRKRENSAYGHTYDWSDGRYRF
jgi:Late competence development protein ComFB